LSRVFVKDVDDSGRNVVLTAAHGDLVKKPDLSLVLTLRDGIRSETTPDGSVTRAMTFDQLELPLESIAPEPFRQRGDKETELTFFELVKYYFNTPDFLDIEDISAEINERLARTVSIFFLPFLALPVGISSRRTSKSLRMVVGVLFLIFYYEVLQFGEAMIRKQVMGPLPALWVPVLVFAGASLWLFWIADRKPGQDPLAHLFDLLNSGIDTLKRLVPRIRRKAAE
jgi:lipopolysaccharide export system permease protein